MLADPKACSYCAGEGWQWSSYWDAEQPCHDCHGSGVVCNLCGKPEGGCECAGEPEKCERCGKLAVACRCD